MPPSLHAPAWLPRARCDLPHSLCRAAQQPVATEQDRILPQDRDAILASWGVWRFPRAQREGVGDLERELDTPFAELLLCLTHWILAFFSPLILLLLEPLLARLNDRRKTGSRKKGREPW